MIDIDAHHGNGAQAIFYERADVLTGSVHVDPAAGWFPHFLGLAGETGGGANRNLPLAPGHRRRANGSRPCSELARWARGLGAARARGRARRRRRGGRSGEPAARHRGRLPRGGRALGALGLPTVIVQEGGYDLETIGALVRATLETASQEATHG